MLNETVCDSLELQMNQIYYHLNLLSFEIKVYYVTSFNNHEPLKLLQRLTLPCRILHVKYTAIYHPSLTKSELEMPRAMNLRPLYIVKNLPIHNHGIQSSFTGLIWAEK